MQAASSEARSGSERQRAAAAAVAAAAGQQRPFPHSAQMACRPMRPTSGASRCCPASAQEPSSAGWLGAAARLLAIRNVWSNAAGARCGSTERLQVDHWLDNASCSLLQARIALQEIGFCFETMRGSCVQAAARPWPAATQRHSAHLQRRPSGRAPSVLTRSNCSLQPLNLKQSNASMQRSNGRTGCPTAACRRGSTALAAATAATAARCCRLPRVEQILFLLMFHGIALLHCL